MGHAGSDPNGARRGNRVVSPARRVLARGGGMVGLRPGEKVWGTGLVVGLERIGSYLGVKAAPYSPH